jgi:hypothetical protein
MEDEIRLVPEAKAGFTYAGWLQHCSTCLKDPV